MADPAHERLQYGHAIRLLAVLLRADVQPTVVADRLDRVADEIAGEL
jgi:metal-dependent HD superfamily phosphatase/phosphodiesterase